ncbi:hypothetical protein ABZ896_08135 [Streptomyces sp. NPDC047072]|uniref:hypothetical protein n=1 Tax=Streptomyces sp. NPDC047072 TaxID=3154809 RepID=UPI0033E65C52
MPSVITLIGPLLAAPVELLESPQPAIPTPTATAQIINNRGDRLVIPNSPYCERLLEAALNAISPPSILVLRLDEVIVGISAPPRRTLRKAATIASKLPWAIVH